MGTVIPLISMEQVYIMVDSLAAPDMVPYLVNGIPLGWSVTQNLLQKSYKGHIVSLFRSPSNIECDVSVYRVARC